MVAAINVKMKFLSVKKHVNYYLVERDTNLVGKSTKWGTFPGGGRNNKLLASAGVLLFPCPSRENPAIWSQFGPRLQNISHEF